MKKSLYLILIYIFTGGFAICGLHDIDKAEIECINNTSDTQIMIRCSETAQRNWEKEINKTLKKICETDKDCCKNLLISQKYWEKYKDSEFRLIDKMFLQKQGTMYKNVSAGFKVDLVKQRALQLYTYLD